MYPRVSIIVLNWNGKHYLKTCLDAVFRQTYPNLEVLFVDNGSEDGSSDFVRTHYPAAQVIVNPENYGFAKANNIAIDRSSGAYVMTLNNDTELDPRCVEELVRVMEQDPMIGSCAPKIIGFEDPPMVVNVGIEWIDRWANDRGYGHPDQGQYDQMEEIFGVNGGAGLFRKTMLEDIGGFDEDFYVYYEDVDLAWRARLAGWQSLYVPTAVCKHVFGGSSTVCPFFKEYHLFRNVIWLYIKNFPLPYLSRQISCLLMEDLVFWMTKLRGREWRWLKMKADTYVRIPRMIYKRWRIQSRIRITSGEFERWFLPTSATKQM